MTFYFVIQWLEKLSETKGHGLRDNQSQRYINIWSTSDPFGLGVGGFQHLCVSMKIITNCNENQAQKIKCDGTA